MTRTNLAIFAKAPVPGYAKTRLAPALGEAGAAALQAELIARTLTLALAAGLGPVSLWCAPDRRHAYFADLAQAHPIALFDQQGADLGARMDNAFATLTASGPTLLFGTDCPPLTPAHLRLCADRLKAGDDAVLLPTEDGGYALIGLRARQPALFADMRWSVATVADVTRQRLRALALAWSEPALLWDLDRPEDLPRWRMFDHDHA